MFDVVDQDEGDVAPDDEVVVEEVVHEFVAVSVGHVDVADVVGRC